MIQKFRAAMGWAAVVLLLVFIILNRQQVEVSFWGIGKITFPLALVILGSAGVGAFAMYMFQAYRRSKDKDKK